MNGPNGSTEALALWQRIAAGERSSELDAWVQLVAQRLSSEVFSAEFDRASSRAEEALKAVGWRGRVNKHAEVDALATAPFAEDTPASLVAFVASITTGARGTVQQLQKRIEYARGKKK